MGAMGLKPHHAAILEARQADLFALLRGDFNNLAHGWHGSGLGKA
jgi:hypothetical protein